MGSRHQNWFQRWFLSNRFSIAMINLLLFFLVLLVFNKISFMLNPVWSFISAVLLPIVLAVVQFYLMEPVVDFFQEKFKIPRVVTIVVLFLLVVLALVWVVNSLIPVIQNQINQLLKNWPSIWDGSVKAVRKMLRDPRLYSVKSNLQQMITNFQKTLAKSSQTAINSAFTSLSSAVSVVTAIGTTLLTAPFILFFLLKDGKKFGPFLTKYMPEQWQDSFGNLLHEMNEAISSYVRGQITVAFCVGVMFAIGYNIVGLPYGSVFAILAGFMNLIPYFGTFIAFVPVLIVATMTSLQMLFNVIIVFAIEQTIESRLISPLVVGNKMNMHPITTILVLLGAGAVAGLWGVIFGIPAYAILKIIVSRCYHYYRSVSEFYPEDSVPEAKVAKTGNNKQTSKQK